MSVTFCNIWKEYTYKKTLEYCYDGGTREKEPIMLLIGRIYYKLYEIVKGKKTVQDYSTRFCHGHWTAQQGLKKI